MTTTAEETEELMKLSLIIENHYELYEMVRTVVGVEVPIPPTTDQDSDDWGDWAQDNLFDYTGAGHEDGDSWYFVEVAGSSRPELVPVGTEFEFGT